MDLNSCYNKIKKCVKFVTYIINVSVKSKSYRDFRLIDNGTFAMHVAIIEWLKTLHFTIGLLKHCYCTEYVNPPFNYRLTEAFLVYLTCKPSF